MQPYKKLTQTIAHYNHFMPNSLFSHSAFIYPATNVIIATAQMTKPSLVRHHHRQAQSACVRALLNATMQRHSLDGRLDDTHFPYQIFDGNQKYFVSFSHSDTQVALIISPNLCAVDIEMRNTSIAIAQRYFHHNELIYLAQQNAAAKKNIINTLWRLKECAIKLHQNKLPLGMKADFSVVIANIVRNQNFFSHRQWKIYNNPSLGLTAMF